MTRDEQLNLIRSKCIEANPEIKEREESYFPAGFGIGRPVSVFSTVRLADVLLAIGAKKDLWLTPDGWFAEYAGNGQLTHVAQWNLRKDDLTEQSDECVSFLYELPK